MRSRIALIGPVIVACLSASGQMACVPVPLDLPLATEASETDSPDSTPTESTPSEQQETGPTPGQLLEGQWSLTLDDMPDDPAFSELRLTFDDDGDITAIELRGGISFQWSSSSIVTSSSEVDGSDVTISATFSGFSSEGNLEFSGTTSLFSDDIAGDVTMNVRSLRIPSDSFNVRDEPATMTPR